MKKYVQQMLEIYSKMIFLMLKREKLNENYHHLLQFKKRKYLLLVKTIKDTLLADETLKFIEFFLLKDMSHFCLGDE